MRTRIENVFSVGHKIAAGSPTFPGTDHFGHTVFKRFVGAHNKHLVALQAPFAIIALEDKLASVWTPICFGIIAAKSHLSQAFEMIFRSEEHTSELQSRPHLVCRLLLEKKKKKQYNQLLYIIS